jgi:phage-related baseplate assembly protein
MPQIIEDLNFQKILSDKLDRFTADYKQTVPEFERPGPADPIYRVLSEQSLTELVIREKINAVGLAQLLKLSAELDFLFAGKRLEGESLLSFRERMLNRLSAISPAGPLTMYEGLAFIAANDGIIDPEVWPILDVYAETKSGKVIVYLQPNPSSAVAPATSLAKVKTFLSQKHIRPALDDFDVQLAVERSINITASFFLESGLGQNHLTKVETALRAAWRSKSRLGWGPAASWIIARLDQEGVVSLTLKTPLDDAKLALSEYASVGRVTFTLGVA